MSTEQNHPPAHPERRPGQRWHVRIDGFSHEYVLTKHEPKQRGWDAKQPDGSYAFVHDALWSDSRFTMTLLSESPAPASRAGCKAFCGMTAGQIPGSKAAEHDYAESGYHPELWVDNRRLCSPACRDARLPPTEAPVEAAKCPLGHDADVPHDHFGEPCKPAQPKVAARQFCCPNGYLGRDEHSSWCETRRPKVAAKVLPVCRLKGIGPHVCDGPILERVLPRLPRGLYCEAAMFTREDSVEQLTQRRRIVPAIEAIRNAPPKPGPLPITDWLDDWLPEAGR